VSQAGDVAAELVEPPEALVDVGRVERAALAVGLLVHRDAPRFEGFAVEPDLAVEDRQIA